MPAYGSYETTRELASGHGSVVYSARKTGENKDNYAIKVFALDEFIGEDSEARTELDPLVADFNRNFTRSVELQRQAAAGSSYIAPILDVGQEPRCVWYATRLYPRTVQKILEGRVALGREWFHHIVLSVARGALDFKKACGRSHGEIQPSNILIGAGDKIRDAAVVLSDPLPGGASEAARYEAADLHAIGEIIYQLVRRREVEDATDHSILPLVASAEWTEAFGKDTDAWLALCNRLLDPNLSLESYNLEKLETDLARLRPKPAVSGKVLAAAAAGLVLLGMAGVYFIQQSGRGMLTITSSPPGAVIQLNGETLPGRTPLKLQRPKGSYEVHAEFPGLDPQTVTIEFRGGRQEERIVFPHGVVILESDPPGASVLVGGTLGGTNLLMDGKPVVTPATLPPMKPATLVYQFDLKGFLSTNLSVVVRTGATTRAKAVLTRPPEGQVMVEFDSIPRGARIDVNGKPFATTLDRKSLLPGTYKVSAFYREFWPVKEATLVVQPNQEAKVQFYFERGRYNLDSDPAGANVFVGNRLIGITPTNLLWPTGAVTFRFEKPGFEPTNVLTRLEQDNDRVDLRPPLVSTNGILIFSVDQAPALVLEAGTRAEVLRTTPGRPSELMRPPGTHSFIIEAPGYQSITTNFLFVSKRRIPVSIRLPAELIPVAFSADPPGVELYDAAIGTSYGALEKVTGLPATTHKLAARQTRYPTLGWITNDVTVVKGRPNEHVFRFPYTTLVITSSPPELKVFEVLESGRREPAGTTPITRNFVKPGPVVLEFIKWDGTQTNRHEFKLEPGTQRVGTYFKPPRPPTYVNSVGMSLEWIPEEGANGGYWVGKYEVTQEQYRAVMGTNFSRHQYPGVSNLPMDSVSLVRAVEFCARLTEMDQASLATRSLTGWKYTLPTTNQWSYFAETNLVKAVIRSNRGRPEPVTSLATNDFGLSGVRGNVWEWCLEGVARGSAYSSFGGAIRPRELDFYYPLVLEANRPYAFDVGFRCLLVPSN